MAVSVSRTQTARPPGGEDRTVTKVTFDTEYEKEGEALAAKDLGLRRVEFAHCSILNGSESATLLVGAAYYTTSDSKVHLIDLKTGKEVEEKKDMSKVVVQVTAYGKP